MSALRRGSKFAAFPLAAFALWRLAQIALLWVVGGDPIEDVTAWDGGWYLRILEDGYVHSDTGAQQPTAFFPFMPWLTRLAEAVVRHQGVAIGLVTNVGAAAAVVAVYGVAAEWRDQRTARWAIAFMLAFPVSYFLWSFYTEAIFIAASAAAFWAHHRGMHRTAAVCAAVVVMTRVPGGLIVVLLVGLRLLETRRIDRVVVIYALAALAVVPVLLAQWIEAGDPLAFSSAQDAWGRHASLPWPPIREEFLSIQDRGVTSVPVLNLAALGLVFIATGYAFARRRIEYWPAESWIWVLLVVGLPLFTARLTSMSRYVLVAWPIFVVVAVVSLRLPAPARVAVWTVSALSSVMVLRWFADGIFVG